ncbi:acetyltransferase [Planctomycetota bacterium]
MSTPVIVLGGGGHAKVLVEALVAQGTEILGVVDPCPELANAVILGVRVIGDDGKVLEHSPEEISLVNGVGTTCVTGKRRELFEHFKSTGYRFATVRHPSSVVASDVNVAEGAQIMAGVVIQPGCEIGENSIVNTRVSVDHDCRIGAHVHLAPGVTLSGVVVVGDGSHVGTAAAVIQGIRIGRNCLVAAGAVVVGDVPDGASVVGIPAR